MEIIKQWVVNFSQHLVMLSDGTYRIGITTNLYGMSEIDEAEALLLIEKVSLAVDREVHDYNKISTADLINMKNYLINYKDDGNYDPEMGEFVYHSEDEWNSALIQAAQINGELKRRARKLLGL